MTRKIFFKKKEKKKKKKKASAIVWPRSVILRINFKMNEKLKKVWF